MPKFIEIDVELTRIISGGYKMVNNIPCEVLNGLPELLKCKLRVTLPPKQVKVTQEILEPLLRSWYTNEISTNELYKSLGL